MEDVDVSGSNVTGVTLRLQRGTRLAGRLVVDGAPVASLGDLTQVRVTLTPSRRSTNSTINGTTNIGGALGTAATAALRADGTFEIVGIAPGAYRILTVMPSGVGAGFWLRSAMVGGADLLDSGLPVPPAAPDISGALLTMTSRHTELAGTLQSATGQPAPDYVIIVLSADRAFWTPESQRVRSTRPGTDGRFSFADLPAGTYLVAALTDVEPNEWQKPEFLEQLVAASVKVTLADGERRVQDLRVVR